MKIGFIGLGNVGGKLAGNLLQNGYDLTVRDLERGTDATLPVPTERVGRFFVADGGRVVFTAIGAGEFFGPDDQLFVWDSNTGEVVQITVGLDGSDPDGPVEDAVPAEGAKQLHERRRHRRGAG